MGSLLNRHILALFTVLAIFFFTAKVFASNHLVPLDPSTVKVDGEIGRRIDITIKNNLLKLDVQNDFLQPFRQKKSKKERSSSHIGYIGYGKLIDATISFAVHTKDPGIIALKDHLIKSLLETRFNNGYIGIFEERKRLFTLWDLHEMVYIIQALVAEHEHFDNQIALDTAKELGDYIMQRRQPCQNPRWVGKLNTERAFLALYRATREKKYLDYGIASENLRNWNQKVEKHAYTFMNICLAQLDLYDMKPSPDLLSQSHKVFDFLQKKNGMVVSGTCSRGERFSSDQIASGNIGETCATAYLIRLLHRMMCIEGKSMYGDIMERGIYNALFAAQLDKGRHLRYFTPLQGKRPVYKRDTYCCPNNFRRIVAELPQMIYYRSNDGGVTVNLYTQSATAISLAKDLDVKLRQETDYPTSGTVALHVDPSCEAQFPLRLRIPRWCKQASVTVNGEKVSQPVESGTFFEINRSWKPDDLVELNMPMEWRLVRGRQAQKGRVAVLRGPMLFCLSRKRFVAMNSGNVPEREKKFAQLSGQLDHIAMELGSLKRKPVDLADLVNGGQGFGVANKPNGIHPYTGLALKGSAGYLNGPTNRFVRVASKFIDGVVVPDGEGNADAKVQVSSTGLKLQGLPDTDGKTWDYVKARSGQGQLVTKVGNVDYAGNEHSMLALHANKIVTFDLAAIREATGYQKLRFRTMVGYGNRPDPTVDVAVYIDGKPVVDRISITRAGLPINIPISTTARFLSLAVTDGGNGTQFDQAFFGNPRLYPDPMEKPLNDEAQAARIAKLLEQRNKLKAELSCYAPFATIMRRLIIDPQSLEKPFRDDMVRPNGVACSCRAWGPGVPLTSPPNLRLLLTEFADSDGEATYFLVKDSMNIVEDELIQVARPPHTEK